MKRTFAPFLKPGTLVPFLAFDSAAFHAASTAAGGTVTVSSTPAPSPSSFLATSTAEASADATADAATEEAARGEREEEGRGEEREEEEEEDRFLAAAKALRCLCGKACLNEIRRGADGEVEQRGKRKK